MLKEYIEKYLREINLKKEQEEEYKEFLQEMYLRFLDDLENTEGLFEQLLQEKREGAKKSAETELQTATFFEEKEKEATLALDEEATLSGIDSSFDQKRNQLSLIPFQLDKEAGKKNPALKKIEKSAEKRYQDLGLLGKGGMGEVRRVRDNVLNRDLAMKIIHSDFLKDKNSLSRFIEEAQVGAQLQHSNIVPIYDLGELEDGRFYFTMKEVKGRGFKAIIKEVHLASTETLWRPSAGGITFRRLIQIFHQICETVAFAHSMNVIHRDLKPSNIMVGDFGEVLVVDWGIAKVLEGKEYLQEETVQTDRTDGNVEATQMGVISGTPAYMSPEQAMGRVDLVGKASDVYTLGVILYQILTGTPPYTSESALEIIEKIKTANPPAILTSLSREKMIPSRQNFEQLERGAGKIPFPLIEICKKAMEREIEDRYPSASELTKDIFAWLEGAKRRDRALKEYTLATEKRQLAEKFQQEYAEAWQDANQLIQSNGVDSNEGWARWIEGKQALQESKQLRREYRKGLQNSLVYDFSLEEANEAMAELVLQGIVSAVANGETDQREILEKQFGDYLQYLSSTKQDQFRSRLQKKRNDEILLLRARKGALVGREKLRREIITALLGQSRLISLVGTAGVGKTRLALEAIYDLQEEDVQTYFCDLTEAVSELGAVLLVAKSMNVQLQNIDPIGQLGELFAARKIILVLDNLEQVIDPIGRVISRWMKQSDSLRIIATSRVKLRLEEEYSFPLQPLSILEGIELFTKRGQKVDKMFALGEDNRQIIGHLVQQLDNLPLAIELGAARLDLFSVAEIAQRLKERFSLLRSRDKGVQALQGALDWSWDLLKPWAKAVLSQSSVFRSGFDLKAAENILKTGEWKDSPPIFDILQDLRDDSLLLKTKSEDGSVRYALLESIRQYSHSKLRDEESIEQGLSGIAAYQQAQQRHAQYYSQFGKKEFLDGLDNQEDRVVWKSFIDELDNFVVAIECGEGRAVSYCCLAALKILEMRGPVSLAIRLAEAVLKKSNISIEDKLQLQIIRIRALQVFGRTKEAQEEYLNLKRRIEESKITEGERLRFQAEGLLEAGNIEETIANPEKANEAYQQAKDLFEKIGDYRGIARSCERIGMTASVKHEYQKASDNLYLALDLAEKHGLFLLKAKVYAGLGKVYHGKSEHEKALEFHRKALEINQRFGNKAAEGSNLGRIAGVYYLLCDYEKAIPHFKQAIKISQEIGLKRVEAVCCANLASVYLQKGQYENAIVFYKQAAEIMESIGDKMNSGINLGNLGGAYNILGQPQKAIFYQEKSLNMMREFGDKGNEGLSCGNLGNTYFQVGRLEEAGELLKEAIELCNDYIPPAAGAFAGSLALVQMKQNNLEEALKTLEKGEPLVSVHPFEYGKFLCKKAKIFQLSNQAVRAEEFLSQARKIAEDLNVNKDSELSMLILETERLLLET